MYYILITIFVHFAVHLLSKSRIPSETSWYAKITLVALVVIYGTANGFLLPDCYKSTEILPWLPWGDFCYTSYQLLVKHTSVFRQSHASQKAILTWKTHVHLPHSIPNSLDYPFSTETALASVSWSTCRYRSVMAMCVCPARRAICSIGTPFRSKVLTYVCLQQWGDNFRTRGASCNAL